MKQGSTPYVKRLPKSAVMRPLMYGLAGALLSGGTFVFSSHPFGIALAAAAGGFSGAASAVCGALIGCLRLDDGTVFAAAISAVFIFRLIIGRWLNPPEHREETPAGSKGEHLIFRLRRYAVEASEVSFHESKLIRMIVSAAASVAAGGVISASDGYRMESIVSTVAAAVISPTLVYLYSGIGDSSRSRTLSEAGRCAVAASAVVSLTGLVPHIDIAPVAAFVIVLLASRSSGTLVGVAYGVVCGAVLSPELSPLLAMAALAAGCLWRVSAAVAVTGACTVGVLWGLYVWGLDAMSTVTPSFIIASAIMAPLISAGVIPKSAGRDGNSTEEMRESVSSYMLRGSESSRRMRTLSESMSDISGVLYRLSDTITSPDTEELAEICEAAFDEHCSRCGMKSSCFGREARRTKELQARMTLQLRENGKISASVIPPDMARRCYSMGEIIDTMNHGFAKRIAEAKLYDRTSVVAADYEVMSDVLRESSDYDSDEYECDRDLTQKLREGLRGTPFSAESIAVFGKRIKRVVARGVNMDSGVLGADDIQSIFSSACSMPLDTPEFELDGARVIMKLRMSPRLSIRCGRASVSLTEVRRDPLRGDRTHGISDDATRIFSPGSGCLGLGRTASEECGDVISAFLTDDKRFFMLISDGMGSGREAAVTSGVCAVFLERMLCAGASMDTALKMLNSMMRVREGECSSTVDLMELDLINGRARFVKSGAAPSFVLRRGRLFRLQSKTVPIGIVRALDAEMIKFETEPGDTVIMLSDGVARSFEDCPWLFDLLCDPNEWLDDPERMARKIVKCAIQNGGDDDITAGVVYIE